MKVIIYISKLLTVIGGLNWGFVGFFGVNPVEVLLPDAFAVQLVYCLVGLGALIFTLAFIGCFGKCCCGCGCGCGSDCDCGCQDGKPCTCTEGQDKADCKCGDACTCKTKKGKKSGK